MIKLPAIIGAILLAFFAVTQSTATVHADEVGGIRSSDTRCDERAGMDFVFVLYNMPKPEHMTWGEWLLR